MTQISLSINGFFKPPKLCINQYAHQVKRINEFLQQGRSTHQIERLCGTGRNSTLFAVWSVDPRTYRIYNPKQQSFFIKLHTALNWVTNPKPSAIGIAEVEYRANKNQRTVRLSDDIIYTFVLP